MKKINVSRMSRLVATAMLTTGVMFSTAAEAKHKMCVFDLLGTQGDVWDTQSDMLFATVGAVVMVALLSKKQDQAIAGLKGFPPKAK